MARKVSGPSRNGSQERRQSVHIHSLSAVIHQKGSYSASKQRFLTVVLESGSLLDSKYDRLCNTRNKIYKNFR